MKKFLESPKFVFLLVLPIFLIGMVLGSFGYSKVVKKFPTSKPVVTNFPLPAQAGLPEIIEEKRVTTKNAKLLNILLTGYGGSGHSGGNLMDAIILLSINLTDKKAGLISIPRDFWFSGHKINSDPSLKDAVAGITGLSVSHFISIDFISFMKMIDSIGGITVDVNKTYVDNFYPIKGKENELCGLTNEQIADVHTKYTGFELEKQFICRYETLRFAQGKIEMNGEEALKYARSRHGSNDFDRSRRQFEILKAILQKTNVASVAEAFNFVNTDLTIEKINEMLTEIGNPLEYSLSAVNLSDENVLESSKSSAGAYILIPKAGQNEYSEIKNYIDSTILH